MKEISAVIISLNEADRVGRCISSLLGLVDEVIVIDSGSKDGTRQIAKDLGAIVVESQWLGYGQTKNVGHEIANNNWILSIDSDEYLSDKLKEEISKLKLNSGSVYSMDRQNIYLGKQVKYSGWSPDWVDRLYEKDKIEWNDNLVHEKLIIPRSANRVRLKHKLIHHSYRSEADHRKKIEKYAALKAQSWVEHGQSPSLLKIFFGAGFKAFHSYILKLGILDGKVGWKLAKMNAFLVRRQLKEYQRLKNQG